MDESFTQPLPCHHDLGIHTSNPVIAQHFAFRFFPETKLLVNGDKLLEQTLKLLTFRYLE